MKDVIIRAAKTFIQAFLSYLSIDMFIGITDLNALKKIALSVLVGAIAAGISAVWNSFLNWISKKLEEEGETDDSE